VSLVAWFRLLERIQDVDPVCSLSFASFAETITYIVNIIFMKTWHRKRALTDIQERNPRRAKPNVPLTVLPPLARGKGVHYEIDSEDYNFK
jgi:hypothetical protein